MARHDRRITRTRTAAVLLNLVAGASLAALVGACNGGPGGVAAYQGDSSHGCRATATRTICPK